jgi:hypothetical protein
MAARRVLVVHQARTLVDQSGDCTLVRKQPKRGALAVEGDDRGSTHGRLGSRTNATLKMWSNRKLNWN